MQFLDIEYPVMSDFYLFIDCFGFSEIVKNKYFIFFVISKNRIDSLLFVSVAGNTYTLQLYSGISLPRSFGKHFILEHKKKMRFKNIFVENCWV